MSVDAGNHHDRNNPLCKLCISLLELPACLLDTMRIWSLRSGDAGNHHDSNNPLRKLFIIFYIRATCLPEPEM